MHVKDPVSLPYNWDDVAAPEVAAAPPFLTRPDEWDGDFACNTRYPAHPIFHHDRRPDGDEVDVESLGIVVGTAFFVAHTGLFLTARHVIEGYPESRPTLSIFVVGSDDYYRAPVVCLASHPHVDIAVGFAAIPRNPPFVPSTFVLGSKELNPGTRVLSYGYSRTVTKMLDRSNELGQRDALAVHFQPSFSKGVVLEYHPRGVVLAKWPAYSHTAETLGGASGGPLIGLEDSAVYGVSSSGSDGDDPYGIAADVRTVFDLPLAFIKGGTTLGELSRLPNSIVRII